MTRHAENPLANLEVLRATEQERPILENLLQLYIHDFSQFCAVNLGLNGKFGYPDLPLYWLEPGRHPFLTRMNGDLAGFMLVRKIALNDGNKNVWDMTDSLFFAECAGVGLERNWRTRYGRCFQARGRYA